MTEPRPVVYEVALTVQAEVAGEYDRWLASHVREMLALPGFRDARILTPEADEAPRGPDEVRRVVQYTLDSPQALDAYLKEHAPRMRADGESRFGGRFTAGRRIYALEEPASSSTRLLARSPAGGATLRCENCGTPLYGKFCIECGQQNHTYVAPLWHVFGEFFTHHLGFDTRFFHSLIPLLFRPGFLTREYSAGRRERYIKPFRLYLFCSILFFFFAAFLLPENILNTHMANESVSKMTSAERQAEQQKLEQGIAAMHDAQLPSAAKQQAIDKMQARLSELQNKPQTPTPKLESPPSPSASSDKTAPPGLSGRLLEAVQRVKDDPQTFTRQLVFHTVPKAMFIFLPLVALMLKLFYMRSGRYYMEHLIFALHFHALFFIVALALTVTAAVTSYYAWPAHVTDTAVEIGKWYTYIYLFLALRTFYRQSWLMTFLKFCLLFVTYWILAGLTIAGAVVVTALEA